jgi:hypothetical protein
MGDYPYCARRRSPSRFSLYLGTALRTLEMPAGTIGGGVAWLSGFEASNGGS